jgi:hypothetical protein
MFRVVVAGAPGLREYKPLRDLLDAVLRDKIPAVTILTRAGAGFGTDALAQSYARSRGLAHIAYPLHADRHPSPVEAHKARLAELVRDADAAVIVFTPSDWQGHTLIAECRRKGITLRVLGAWTRREVEAGRVNDQPRLPEPEPLPRGCMNDAGQGSTVAKL